MIFHNKPSWKGTDKEMLASNAHKMLLLNLS